MRNRRGAALLVAAAVLAAGCGRGSAEPRTFERNEQIPIELSIEFKGDLRARVENRTIKTTLVMLDTDDPELATARIFGLDTEQVKTDGVAFTAGFAVTSYKGEGTYTIRAGSPYDAADKAQDPDQAGKKDGSSIQVQWSPTGDLNVDPMLFLRREKACKARIEDKGNKGSLTCPRLTQEGTGKHFSLDLHWEVP